LAKYFERKQILERLQKEADGGKPILMFGAGIALTAKCAEIGGADLIAVYSTLKAYPKVKRPKEEASFKVSISLP